VRGTNRKWHFGFPGDRLRATRLSNILKEGVFAGGTNSPDKLKKWSGPARRECERLEWMVKDGMTPARAVKAATGDAAQLLGWQDRVDTIEPGKFADLIAIDGDPLKDITELQHVRFVMKGGVVVKNELDEAWDSADTNI
jgi:cytosine/adenosine deaminase-related metal-dependent hydrolase